MRAHTNAAFGLCQPYNGDAEVVYEYDDLYRLTKEECTPAQGSSRQAYTFDYWYDAVGNRTKFTRTDQWYPTAGRMRTTTRRVTS